MDKANNLVKLTINGKEVEASPERTILEVVEELKLDEIPTLCHSPELKPYGSCFLCVVEVEGRPNLLPACATRVTAGMKVETKNHRVKASRRTALELLVSNHYADCLSPCMLGCPAGVDAQGYVALAAMGEFRQALDLVRDKNPLPAICGRVCVRKCEIVCRRMDVDEAVGINYIKRFLSDQDDAYEGLPEREPQTGKKIAIVGSGPAGLTAAWFLGRKGHDPVIFEALPKPGGMLRYGIPEYRLPKEVLDREIEYIGRVGATIHTGVTVGRDKPLDGLMKEFDAVFIAAGALGSKDMGVPGEHETEGVVAGVDFLIEKTEDRTPVKGTVVVVGGGNTAMDVARTAWRLGADKVIILYRRTKAEMPADKLEIEDCIKEGIEIMELAAPVEIVAENGKLKALKCIRMSLGEPDASGRRRPVPMEGSEFELPCDIAAAAIGQSPILEGLAKTNGGPEATRWNTIVVNEKTLETNVPGLYAGGDVAGDGPTIVIDAIRDGQRAAKAIHSYLTGVALEPEEFIVTKAFWSKPGLTELGEIGESPRHEMHEIGVDERRESFAEVATGYDDEDVSHESSRCLSCGCVVFDSCKLRKFSGEYGVDMERFKGYARKHKVDDRHPYISYDPNKCILCARCIRTCERVLPISALGLVSRGFVTEMRPAMNKPLAETNCVSCGNCVDACPVGSLTIKYPFPGRACVQTTDVETRCALCSIGCRMVVHRIGDTAYYIMATGEPGEYLCRYGRFGNELFIKHKRLFRPRERVGAQHTDISFEDAIAKAASGLKEIAEKYGNDAVAVFISPELSNEELYLASHIAREAIGTNNIGSLTSIMTGLDSGALDESFGFTASTAGMSAIKQADLIVCNNTDTETDHLIINSEILIAVKENEAKLIVSNSTTDPLYAIANLSLDPMRGRSALLWNGVIQELLERGFFDREAVGKLQGGGEFLGDIFDYGSDSVASVTGVDAAKIKSAADIIEKSESIVFVHSPDRPQDQSQGDMVALANFVLLLRSKGVKADLLLPSVLANAAGMEVSGASSAFLPGRIPSGKELPGARSQNELRELLKDGKIRGALIIGEDPMHSDRTASLFANAEFVAAIDWAETETMQFANVSIPGSTYLESGGTRVNFEGRLIEFNKAVTSPSRAANWQILSWMLKEFAVETPKTLEEVAAKLDAEVTASLGELAEYYWNKNGGERGEILGRLRVASVAMKPSPIPPVITVTGKYKADIREVGTERYRVR